MSNEVPDGMDGRKDDGRMLLQTALIGMSEEQLYELRKTIIRLKHLPFTKMVEALFTSPEIGGGSPRSSTQLHEDGGARVQDFRGHCESSGVRELFEDVEVILRERETTRRE